MNENNNFTGQPIFNQLLSFIPRKQVRLIASHHGADRYCKKLFTWDHLVVMLFTAFKGCVALRELATDLLAYEGKLAHLGLKYSPPRSTLADANARRPSTVFGNLYHWLFNRYVHFLPDSQLSKAVVKKLYIMDSTVISLFKEILKTAGRYRLDGKRKGGIKVHTLISADAKMPVLIRYTAAAAHDSSFLAHVHLSPGSYITFDKGYNDYNQYQTFTRNNIFFITRLKDNAVYTVKRTVARLDKNVLKDETIELETTKSPLKLRKIIWWDEDGKRTFVYLTNNFKLKAATIASIYRYRWQIELMFKKLKQNFPLKYFLGDSPNAIEIQIWCALIAMLLLTVVHRQVKTRWAFSTVSAMVRCHLMNYIELFAFLNNPEKAWKQKNEELLKQASLFPT